MSSPRYTVLRILVVCLVAIAGLICCGAVAVHLLLYNLNHTRTGPTDIRTVANWSGAKFPSRAKLLHSIEIYHSCGLSSDHELYAEVEIERKDVSFLVDELRRERGVVLSRKSRMRVTNSLRNWRNDVPVPAWWHPDSARQFIACDSWNGRSPLLLISLDDPNKATVWIHTDTDGPPSSDRE